MATTQLTDRQQDVYDMIRELIVGRGYGPTVREIGEHFQIKSPNGVMCHLRALERKGLITRSPNKSRAIELTNAAHRNKNSLPMAGVVNAVPAALATGEQELVDFSDMLSGENRFILQISGDSMIDAQIRDGDYVVVQKQSTAEPGQMVLAETSEGEATLKYWHPEANRVRLQPANSELPSLYVTNATVLGVAVGVVRSAI